MTIDRALGPGVSPFGAGAVLRRIGGGKTMPLSLVLAATLVLWYLGAIWLNAPLVEQRLEQTDGPHSVAEYIGTAYALDRPILPAPHQVAIEFYESVFDQEIDSPRSLLFHAYVTGSAALVGFLFGTVLGVLLAVGIVHLRTLDRSLLPWIIASQTVPILAIAPMIIVVLGNLGLTGLVPKAVISMYLCFFPVTIGMVKGLRSPDLLQLDLMRTYSATPSQVFWKLRWPAAMTFLFTSLKVAVAISLVGAIVGELPTGAQAGIGARLLVGSYYGQTVQIWSALLMAAVLGMVLVAAVGVIERATMRQMGAQP
ncbi:MAG TPA: ABC transporter permease [Candidatus Cybelea sp.]|nr:ABC transporter permease [Candidatus Cybelea sp.]